MTEIPFYIGSYSVASPWAGAPRGHGAGITRATIDDNSGFVEIGPHTAQLNPSFLARNDRQRRVWAIASPNSGARLSHIAKIAAGDLTLSGRVATGADAPCHIAVDWDRRLAFASHYHGGVLALLALGESGEPQRSLSLVAPPAIARGEDRGGASSQVHASARLGNDELLVTDTGRDLILLYRIVTDRSAVTLHLLDALPLPAGTGPRHLALHDATGAVYVSNQNTGGVSVVVRAASDEGPRLALRGVAACAGLGRDRCVPSEIAVHPTLGMVYMANRIDDSISVFSIEFGERGSCPARQLRCHGCQSPPFPGNAGRVVAGRGEPGFGRSDESFGWGILGRRLTYTGSPFAVATPTAICF